MLRQHWLERCEIAALGPLNGAPFAQKKRLRICAVAINLQEQPESKSTCGYKRETPVGRLPYTARKAYFRLNDILAWVFTQVLHSGN